MCVWFESVELEDAVDLCKLCWATDHSSECWWVSGCSASAVMGVSDNPDLYLDSSRVVKYYGMFAE